MLTLSRFRLLNTIVPAATIGVLFECFLHHRHDYAGHFLGGYGATLAVFMIWMRELSSPQFSVWAMRGNFALYVFCILLGVGTEATIFRIAKFDEIDFCNQSLGAVVAALVALSFAGKAKPPVREFDYGLIAGIAFLGAGGCFAVA